MSSDGIHGNIEKKLSEKGQFTIFKNLRKSYRTYKILKYFSPLNLNCGKIRNAMVKNKMEHGPHPLSPGEIPPH